MKSPTGLPKNSKTHLLNNTKLKEQKIGYLKERIKVETFRINYYPRSSFQIQKDW